MAHTSHLKNKTSGFQKDKEPKSLTLEECVEIITNAPKKSSKRRKK